MNLLNRALQRARRRAEWWPGLGRLLRAGDGLPGVANAARYHSPPSLALGWVKALELPSGGLGRHSGSECAHPGLTCAMVPTLMALGEGGLAQRLVKWLLHIQTSGGVFPGADGKSSLFDMGQVLKALITVSSRLPEARGGAERAATDLLRRMTPKDPGGSDGLGCGAGLSADGLMSLSALKAAGEALNRLDIQEEVQGQVKRLSAIPKEAVNRNQTYVLARALDALLDLGRLDLARDTLERLAGLQNKKGRIPAEPGRSWTCFSGLAHLALCWYKASLFEPAERAMNWLDEHQSPSGGFVGSQGRGAEYFPSTNLAWAAKWYLDAHGQRLRMSFNGYLMDRLPSEIPETDGRAQQVLNLIRGGEVVAEIGCGHGRFLGLVRRRHPDTRCIGVDISTAMLARLPAGVEGREGSLESIPLDDGKCDVAFSVEAIEHAVNPEAAVAEMIRITRPGGWVLIIDKQQAHWGRKKCPPWERWPSLQGLAQLLREGCAEVCAYPIAYNHVPASDGLMVAWLGRKSAPAAPEG